MQSDANKKNLFQPHEYNLLNQEFTEAWNHFRHLEKNRNLYVSFFITIVLASIGFFVKVSLDPHFNFKWPIVFGLWTLAWFVNIVSTLIFTSVKKTGYSLKHYKNVIQRVRDQIYSEPIVMGKLFWVGDRKKPIKNSKNLSVQKSVEKLFIITLVALDFFQYGLLLYFILSGEFPLTLIIFSIILFLLILYIHWYIHVEIIVVSKVKEPKEMLLIHK